MRNGLDNDCGRIMNYALKIDGKVNKSEFIAGQKKLLKEKQARLKDLQAEAQDSVARGNMPLEDTLKKIKKLKNEIIPNIKKTIALESERM